jgi:hypothetical protein
MTLLMGTHPVGSLDGIIWMRATFAGMLLLAFGKRMTGSEAIHAFDKSAQVTGWNWNTYNPGHLRRDLQYQLQC